MSVFKIVKASGLLARKIVKDFKNQNRPNHLIEYDDSGDLKGDFEKLFSHRGLYGFRVTKAEQSAIAYIGKSEGPDRLRQHLTGKNKDGAPLATSVATKHRKLKEAIDDGFAIHLCVFSNKHFDKPSMSCLEIATAIYAKSDCSVVFEKFKHWNERIG